MNSEKINQNKAVVYCRVSTKEQVEEGNSLVTQERICREYASKYSYEIVRVFIEEGESAKTADRTELQKLLAFCSNRKEKIKAIIIYKIDRLSRNTDDYSQLRILLKRYGVEIKSTSEYFENNPAGRFMENIIANVAQFDNDVRTERCIGGMQNAIREGRYVWLAPIGYVNQKMNGKSTIIPNEKAPLVKKAFEMVAERIYTTEKVRQILIPLGLTTRVGKPLLRSGFYEMLNNELYCGWINKLGERHAGTFEPLVKQELFLRVQQVLKKKKTPTIYCKENPDFPLRRFVVYNQKKLTGSWSKGKYKSYAYYRFIGTKLYWRKEELENRFQSFMDEYSFDPELLNKLRNQLVIRFSNKSDRRTSDLQALVQKKDYLKSKQYLLIEKNLKGIISDILLKDQNTMIDEEIWNIDRILMQAEEKKFDLKGILEFIIEYLQKPSAIWNKMPFHIKLNLQKFQFPQGVAFDGMKFRTSKMSNLFKLKDMFLSDSSFNVDHSGQNIKHTNLAKYPPVQHQENLFWDEIQGELSFLHELINSGDKL
jgi:site-specific DNA recombinase